MRLTGIEVENVKRLKLVRIKPKPGTNVIKGPNGAGKSSFVDAIQYLFVDAKKHPPKVIRKGETEARVVGETEDFIATRRWWKDSLGQEQTEVEVRARDGSELKSPQALLNKLFNATAFDPVEYTRKKPAEQAEVLRKVAGIDTTPLDNEHDKTFAKRTNVNRDLAALEARLKAMSADPPPEKVDTKELLSRQTVRRGHLEGLRRAKVDAAAAKRLFDSENERVSAAKAAVKAAQEALAEAERKRAEAMTIVAIADNVVEDAEDAAVGADAEIDKLTDQIQKASAIAAAHARWEERTKLSTEVEQLAATSDQLTKMLEGLRAQREAMVRSAKFPVPGLGFGGDGVTLDGLPLEQASQAQKLRVSVAIALALNPKLRVMLVREGSLLDDDSLAMLEKLCDEHDAQAFVEQVGTDGAATVVFVDGEARNDL